MNYILEYATNINVNYTIVLYNSFQMLQVIDVNKNNGLVSIIKKPITIFNDTVIKLFYKDEDNMVYQLFTSIFQPNSPLFFQSNLNSLQSIPLLKTSSPYKTLYSDNSTYLSEIFINQKCFSTFDNILAHIFLKSSTEKGDIIKLNINPKDYIYYPYGGQIYKKFKNLSYLNNIILTPNSNADTIIAPFDSIIERTFSDRILFKPSSDNAITTIPQSGKLIKYYDDGNSTIMEFVNEYFIPKSVSERDLASVHNGNYTYSGVGVGMGNRNYPYKILPQPNTELRFQLFFNKVINKKFINIKDFYYAGDTIIDGILCEVTFITDRPIKLLNKLDNTFKTFINKDDSVAIIR